MSDLNINSEEFIKKYVRKRNAGYHIWRFILRPLAYLVYRPKFYGRENIPEKGGVILAVNHIHMPDPIFVIISTKRIVRFLAKKELLESALSPIYRTMATIPVDRDGNSHNTIMASEYALKEGEVIGIFPEGTRNRNKPGDLLPFKYGAVSMASKLSVPIVPIILKSGGRPFLDGYKVIIGEAYLIDKDSDLDKENERLREKMLELMNGF